MTGIELVLTDTEMMQNEVLQFFTRAQTEWLFIFHNQCEVG
jgi:hypothetical protein